MASRNEERSKKYAAFFIIGVLALSSIGFLTFYIVPDTSIINDSGQRFETQQDGTYLAELRGAKIAFTYLPSALASYPVNPEVFNRLNNANTVFITSQYPHTYQEAYGAITFDLSNILADFFGKSVIPAFTTQVGSAPVATCADSSVQIPVISIENRNGTGIFMEGDCLLISGQRQQDFVRMRDRMIYGFFGII